ncbi:hypothetical protein PF008_g31063 [Phytophthora fragariae]|uniref:Uncharacterized protein n=1 Tax=Phytophthora fragariae TaxID=53985 RepID=A0A6G0Q4I8_9STRA|nr:hypothetical protein PF003_g32822 [Phytophthora fragariae]KAE8883177.1 hypothetical protein PF003_g32823 [Phytophthora fragariae]KAE9268684.1 hypothetical protein PF008_g31063 [Phytophthora fragariae]
MRLTWFGPELRRSGQSLAAYLASRPHQARGVNAKAGQAVDKWVGEQPRLQAASPRPLARAPREPSTVGSARYFLLPTTAAYSKCPVQVAAPLPD